VNKPIVDARGIHKHFGALHVLKGVDLLLAERELVFVIGPSGSGKSTLLRCLNRLEEPSAGSVVVDGIDMLDALHPQTILAYGMNGRDLPIGHGAPLRVRVETQLGYKSMKFLRGLVVTNEFDDNGPYGMIQNGWSWYAGI